MGLQDKLYNDLKNGAEVGRDFSLEDGLLIVGGIDDEGALKNYTSKIDFLENNFKDYLKVSRSSYLGKAFVADSLNNFIGFGNVRYGTDNGLVEVLDNKFNGSLGGIGNCSGLSKLYSVLGLRMDLDLKLADEIKKNKKDGHVYLKLNDGVSKYNIETTIQNGFGEKKIIPSLEMPIEALFYLSLIESGDKKETMEEMNKYYEIASLKPYFKNQLFNNWGVSVSILGEDNERSKELLKNVDKNDLMGQYNLGMIDFSNNDILSAKRRFSYVYRLGDDELRSRATEALFKITEKERESPSGNFDLDASRGEDFCLYG